MKQFSKLLSIVFHPLLMPSIGLFLVFNIGSHITYVPIEVKRIVYITVFVSSCLLPISIIPMLLALKQIKTIYMKSKRERIWPMFITGMLFFAGFYFLSLIPTVPAFILKYISATIIAVYASLIITFYWKISIHMVGIGGLAGGLLAFAFMLGIDLHLLMSLILTAAGLLGVARLYLDAHTPAQVYAGFMLGFAAVFTFVLV